MLRSFDCIQSQGKPRRHQMDETVSMNSSPQSSLRCTMPCSSNTSYCTIPHTQYHTLAPQVEWKVIGKSREWGSLEKKLEEGTCLDFGRGHHAALLLHSKVVSEYSSVLSSRITDRKEEIATRPGGLILSTRCHLIVTRLRIAGVPVQHLLHIISNGHLQEP